MVLEHLEPMKFQEFNRDLDCVLRNVSVPSTFAKVPTDLLGFKGSLGNPKTDK